MDGKNAYGGHGENGSDELNFIEQVVQKVSAVKLMLEGASEKSTIVIFTRAEYDALVKANDQACDLVALRRDRYLASKKEVA